MESRRDVYQAIADPTRREIICYIAGKAENLTTLAKQFDMSRQAVSLHVKILHECGVISITQEGRERMCSLQIHKLEEVIEWLEPFRKLLENRFLQLDEVLTNLKSENHEN